MASFQWSSALGAFLVKIGWSRREELGEVLTRAVVVLGIVLFAFGCALFIQGNYLALETVLSSESEPHICDELGKKTKESGSVSDISPSPPAA